MTKFCKDCIQYISRPGRPLECLRELYIEYDLVTGMKILNMQFCDTERRPLPNKDVCGPEGKYFVKAPWYKRICR